MKAPGIENVPLMTRSTLVSLAAVFVSSRNALPLLGEALRDETKRLPERRTFFSKFSQTTLLLQISQPVRYVRQEV